MAFPILETERLRLVEIEQSYCQKIYEIFSLDEVTCYYGILLQNLDKLHV